MRTQPTGFPGFPQLYMPAPKFQTQWKQTPYGVEYRARAVGWRRFPILWWIPFFVGGIFQVKLEFKKVGDGSNIPNDGLLTITPLGVSMEDAEVIKGKSQNTYQFTLSKWSCDRSKAMCSIKEDEYEAFERSNKVRLELEFDDKSTGNPSKPFFVGTVTTVYPGTQFWGFVTFFLLLGAFAAAIIGAVMVAIKSR